MNMQLTKELFEVSRLTARASDVEDMLSRALEALGQVVSYDLASILELRGSELRVRCSRGPLSSDRLKNHVVSVLPDSPINKALQEGQAIVLAEHDHAQGLDPYHGVVDLPDGHGCLVVPLIAANEILGAMTFDRAQCGTYSSDTVAIVSIYGQLVALAIIAARHSTQLENEKRVLLEQNRLLASITHSEGVASKQLTNTNSRKMHRVISLAKQVARTEAPVLILGETGSGKEVLAHAIHEWSDRKDASFVRVNCAALPEALLESELFGHVRGAFSGADRDRPGRFLMADGGTLLLDELGDMPLASQAKLLRVLQEGAFEALGSDVTVSVNVRVLAATHVDLKAAIAKGRFREDLYYRLSLFPISLPPLRERTEDVILIAERFLETLSQKTGRGPWFLSATAIKRLEQYEWPGNVRELVHCLERATILKPLGELDEELAPTSLSEPLPLSPDLVSDQFDPTLMQEWPKLHELEAEYLRRVLEKTNGRIYGSQGAAEMVGLKPTTLQSRLNKLGVERPKRK